jgi:hypothetical protein
VKAGSKSNSTNGNFLIITLGRADKLCQFGVMPNPVSTTDKAGFAPAAAYREGNVSKIRITGCRIRIFP